MRRQRGFTLVELLAVMAIIGILAGVVAGSVSGLGASGQNAQIKSDTKTLETSADRFFNDSFPQTYPVSEPDTNGDGDLNDLDSPPLPAGDVNVRLIDFDARLPQDPTKTFAPDFIKDIPNSAALVSYRVVTTTGDVFPAADGAALIPPSNSRLDVTVADKSIGAASSVTFNLAMSKNRAAVELLKTQIPAGFIIGGQSLSLGVEVGKLDIFFDVDNPWKPGHVLKVSAPVLATGQANKWEVSPNYSTARSQSDTSIVVDTVRGELQVDGVNRDPGPTLTHKLGISQATTETPGTLTLEMDREGTEAGPFPAGVPHNESKETWVLKIFSHPGEISSEDELIINPTLAAVYRWVSEEHSTIQVEDVFEPVSGKQAVLVKDDAGGESSTGDPDTTGPIISAISPIDRATGVAVGTDIIVTFSEEVDPTTVDETAFKVEDDLNIPVSGVVTVYGDNLGATFNPTVDLEPGTTYTVDLTSVITDVAGNPLTAFSSSFTTGAVADTTGPTVLSVTPVDNATGVAVAADIVVQFSESVNASTLTSFSILVGGSPIAGSISTNNFDAVPNTEAVFDPTVDLEPDTTYTVDLTSVITDVAGNPLTAFSSSFTTEVDTILPVVTALEGILVAAADGSGTPDTNAEIAAFLAGASAFDNFDGSVTVTNNAPDPFPVGVTTVTFSAIDAAGNTGTATATVTVANLVACGVPITTFAMLVDDLNCTATSGTVLTIDADNVTLYGQNHKILVSNPSFAMKVTGRTGVSILDLDLSGGAINGIKISGGGGNLLSGVNVSYNGASPSGFGVQLENSNNNIIEGLTATNRNLGVYLTGASGSNTIEDSNLSGNNIAIHASQTGQGNRYLSNNLSGASTWAILVWDDDSVEISGNDYTLAVNGIFLGGVVGVTVDGENLAWTGSGKSGIGLELHNSNDNIVQNLISTNRSIGVRLVGASGGNTIKDSNLSGNNTAIHASQTGQGNRYLSNNLSGASTWAILVWDDDSVEISGNNYTLAVNGIFLGGVVGVTIDGENLAWTGSGQGGIGLELQNSTGNTIQNLISTNRSMGVRLTGTSSGNTIQNNDLSGDIWGIHPVVPASGNIYSNNTL